MKPIDFIALSYFKSCFLFLDVNTKPFNFWGNRILQQSAFEVDTVFYKSSYFL